MYKKQMSFQKIACYLAVISGAIAFIYSMGMMTDLYDGLYFTIRDPKNPTKTQVPGTTIYYEMQDFNSMLLYLCLGLLLLGALLFLMQTHNRRRYYIGNYASTALFAGSAVGLAGWLHQQVGMYKTQFLTTVDFEALADYASKRKHEYIDSTFWFDAHYFVIAVLLIAAVVVVANLIWKISLQRAEKQLLENGKGQ